MGRVEPINDLPGLMEAAKNGNQNANITLGLAYLNGNGVDQSDVDAMKCFRVAANQGRADAAYNAGLMFQSGKGCEGERVNHTEAVKWFRVGAYQKFPPAELALGLCYLRGFGLARDTEEAVKQFRLAAEHGHAQAQYSYAVCLMNGQGVLKDEDEALTWFKLAAIQGLVDACVNCGNLYLKAENGDEAARFYTKAAEAGDPDAQLALGILHTNGVAKTIVKDYKKAMGYFMKAAKQDNPEACFNVYVGLNEGKGVKRNETESMVWLRKAASLGHKVALTTLRDLMTDKLGSSTTAGSSTNEITSTVPVSTSTLTPPSAHTHPELHPDLAETRVCSQCGVLEMNRVERPLMACGRCRKVLYCSAECQKSAWKSGHKKECMVADE